jgi:hypothetical protein
MKKVTEKNHREWLDYAKYQKTRISRGYKDLVDGVGHFWSVLDSINPEAYPQNNNTLWNNNELWIAYITKKPENDGDNIRMFVTVVSSSEALITTHMGISASFEAMEDDNREKGISIDLHSFAARVMLMRNPNRKYMITTPVTIMRRIIIDALPNDTFLGTIEMINDIKEDQKMTIEEYIEEKKFDPSATREYIERRFGYVKYPRSFKNIFTRETKLADREKDTNELIEFMEKHPPVLSAKYEKRKSILSEEYKELILAIYDSNDRKKEPITINKGDPTYNWLFISEFKPVTDDTYYVAVNLEALANSKQIE